MIGERPEQAVLTRDTDMTKIEQTRSVIENMVDGLSDHRIADIGDFLRTISLGGQSRMRYQRWFARLSGELVKTILSRVFG